MAYIQFFAMLQILREDRNLTRKQVAEAIGVHARTYANWENGDTYPDVLNITDLADFYGVSLDFLCGRAYNGNAFSEMERKIIEDVLRRNPKKEVVGMSR